MNDDDITRARLKRWLKEAKDMGLPDHLAEKYMSEQEKRRREQPSDQPEERQEPKDDGPEAA